jgi:preprotein translocase subunit SecA
VRNFLRNSGMKDGAAIESKMVSNSIEKAQRRVEEHNFGIRRRLLEYDEVMNEQRKLIYDLRQRILEWRDTRETLMGWIEDTVALEVERLGGAEDPPPAEVAAQLAAWAKTRFDTQINVTELEGQYRSKMEEVIIAAVKAEYEKREKDFGQVTIPLTKVVSYSADELMLTGEARVEMVRKKVSEYANVPLERVQPTENPCFSEAWVPIEPAAPVLFNPQEVLEGRAPSLVHSPQQMLAMRKLEHDLLLNIIDDKWKSHLQDMDALREGIHLRGYAQKDPKLEYKREGFDKFMEMFSNMKEQATQVMFQIQMKKEIESMEVAKVWNEDEAKTVHADAGSVFDSMSVPEAVPAGGMSEGGEAVQAASEHGGSDVRAVGTIRGEKVTQPNDPCPCGSGKKFKKCHGRMGGDQEIAGKARVGG